MVLFPKIKNPDSVYLQSYSIEEICSGLLYKEEEITLYLLLSRNILLCIERNFYFQEVLLKAFLFLSVRIHLGNMNQCLGIKHESKSFINLGL